MKYLDEYSFGIYPYVPEHMEQTAVHTFYESPADPYISNPRPTAPAQPQTMRGAGRQRMPQPQDSLSADPFPYNYPQNYELALQLIKESLMDESEDKSFYAQILSAAPAQEDRKIITGIRNDEMKHFELFRKLYYELTGDILPPPPPYENATRMPYCQALKKALVGETAAIAKYRKILFGMQDRRHVNMLTEIITDEIRHADLYGLLISMNGCFIKKDMDNRSILGGNK